MKLLLDTNVFYWATCWLDRLSSIASSTLLDPGHERFVSMASLWEIQIKHGIGKLPLLKNIDQVGHKWMRALAAQALPIELRHLGKLYELPNIHRDPFDRILVAQAMSEDMTVISADKAFHLYDVPVIW